MAIASAAVRLAIVGDVHGDWCERRDGAALQALGKLDAVLFVGDFGEEAIDLVVSAAGKQATMVTPPPPPPPTTTPRQPERIVMLGNHDAWYSLTSKGRRRAAVRSALAEAGLSKDAPAERPQQRERRRAVESAAALAAEEAEALRAADHEPEDPAALGPGAWAQLRALGDAHAGFRHWGPLPSSTRAAAAARDDDDDNGRGALVSVVGARPFSKGGAGIGDCARFYRAFCGGVSTVEQSAARVSAAAREAPMGRSIVVLAHNGPAGLGAARHDPCGVDWLKGSAGGDHGDADLRMALDALHAGEEGKWEVGEEEAEGAGGRRQQRRQQRQQQKRQRQRRHVALVAHGHMHHRLRGGGDRRMVHVDAERRTVVLNAATVPRVRWAAPADDEGGEGGGGAGAGAGAATLRHFLLVELCPVAAADDDEGFASADVERAEDVWVRVEEEDAQGGALSAAEDEDDGRLGGKSGGRPPAALPPRAVVTERREVLRTARGEGEGGGVLKLAWDAAAGRWTQHVWQRRPRRAGEEAGGSAEKEKEAAAAALPR